MHESKLLDQWLAPEGAGPPIACLSTSFTFDPGFFEEQCLARFLGLDSALVSGAPDQDSLVYVLERETRLDEVKASVLVERANSLAPGTHRWDVIPVRAPNGGVQHSKLCLLIWRDAMRLVVGSANLTDPGYRSNIEIFFSMDFPRDSHARPVLRDASTFLRELIDRGTEGSGVPDSPRGRALATLALVDERAVALPEPRRGPQVAFVQSLSGLGVLEAAFSRVWGRGRPPRRYVAVSPYFDRAARLRGFERMEAQLSKGRGVVGELAVAADEAGEDQVRVRAPRAVTESRQGPTPWLGQWPHPDGNDDRFVHAKAFLFESRNRVMLVAGSANLTQAALQPSASNIEACIAVADSVSSSAGRNLVASLPELDELPDGERFYEVDVSEDEHVRARLPDGFVEALYEPDRRRILISLDPARLPARWTILGPEGAWFVQDDARRRLERGLGDERAPTQLTVEWVHEDGVLAAPFVVSVANAAELPDPAEVADVTLDELLDLLAAGGRLRALLERLVRRRERGQAAANGDNPELDPHAKVDTSDFILQRGRRAGHALEGLRQRLSQPVSHADALTRRLRGPFGPLALARALARAEADGTVEKRERAFLLAEIALVVKRVRWNPVGALSENACRRAARAVARELRPTSGSGDEAIDDYMKRVFRGRIR